MLWVGIQPCFLGHCPPTQWGILVFFFWSVKMEKGNTAPSTQWCYSSNASLTASSLWFPLSWFCSIDESFLEKNCYWVKFGLVKVENTEIIQLPLLILRHQFRPRRAWKGHGVSGWKLLLKAVLNLVMDSSAAVFHVRHLGPFLRKVVRGLAMDMNSWMNPLGLWKPSNKISETFKCSNKIGDTKTGSKSRYHQYKV